MKTQQLTFSFLTSTDNAATVRHAGKDLTFVSSTKNGVALTKQQIHELPALYTYTPDGHRIRKQNQPQVSSVNWNELACEAALPMEPVADDEVFAVKR